MQVLGPGGKTIKRTKPNCIACRARPFPAAMTVLTAAAPAQTRAGKPNRCHAATNFCIQTDDDRACDACACSARRGAIWLDFRRPAAPAGRGAARRGAAVKFSDCARRAAGASGAAANEFAAIEPAWSRRHPVAAFAAARRANITAAGATTTAGRAGTAAARPSIKSAPAARHAAASQYRAAAWR